MKIISFKSILLFLLSATLAIGAVTDVVIGQRAGASSRFVQRTITGSSNVFKPIGFDSTGVLSATAQLRGMSLRTPNGNSAVDITSDGIIKISINSVDSINAGTRKLINSSGVETVDWNTNTLSNNWSVTGNLRVVSEVVTGTAMAANAIDTSKALNTKTLTDNATLTFSSTPTTGQVFGVEIKNTKASAITVTIPSSKDYNTGATVTSITVSASPGRTNLQWRYDGTDYIVNGVTVNGFPLTANADFGGFSVSNANIITATSFVGDGSGLTLLTAGDLVGTIPDITTETLTTSRSRVVTPVAGVSNAINTGNGDTTITLDATTETLTYSAQPATGTRFEYSLTGHSADSVVTIPSTYSHALGSLRTSFTVPATKNVNIMVKREAGRYVMWGDPVSITDYPANTTPTTDGILEVDQDGSSTRSTLGQIKALIITNSKTGTHASPSTTTPLSPTWTGTLHNVFTGVTGTINLPAAASYAEKSITIYNTGSFTITVDSNSSEVIVRDGTVQTGGVSFTLSSGAGNYVTLICDGTRWITLGFKGTLAQGS